MEETYWDRRVRRIEARAQLYATEKSKLIQKLYVEQRDKLLKDVDALYAQIQDKGADSLTRTQLYRYSRYQSIIKDARAGAQVIMTTQQRYVDEAVRAAYKSTFGMTMEELLGKGDWNHVSQNLIDAYLKTPWSGEDYSKRIWQNTNKLAHDLEKHIGDIIVQGKSPSELKKQLVRDYNVDYSVADRLVRTEVSAAHANASMQSYREGGLEYVQVLDAGGIACGECIDIAYKNGGIYPINDAPRVPVHPRCRCCYSPVLNDDKRIKQYYGGENAPKSSDIAPKPAENQEKGLAKASKDDIIKMTNKEVREYYVGEVAKIPSLINRDLPAAEQAKQAFEMRNELRTKARDMMEDQELRMQLESTRPMLSFEQLVDSKMSRKRMSRAEAIADILLTASKTNENVNKELGLNDE
ncbi:MAG: minor capsid protein [Eubacteriales bacterium]|nr:minor capsid protein [Eubacteriales bacterium]